MTRRRTLAALLLFACGPTLAQQPAPAGPPAKEAAKQTERAARRFPQPVRVGDLLRRQVLRPVEQQNVLGRVAGVVQRPDGAILIVVSLGGVLGVGARPIAVPVEATALLGEHLALLDLTPDQLRALPTFDAAGTTPLSAARTIVVGLTRPFH
jgi:hypothetical protein